MGMGFGMGFALATKVDSNLTGLRYAYETSIGVVPTDGSAVWFQLDPNSYSGFGAQMTLTERTPINPARMRRKGIITDLAADAGFQMDLTKSNARGLLPGFMFAAWQDKYTLNPSSVTSAHYVVAAGGATFTTNDLIFAYNFLNAQNNGLKAVSAVTSTSVSASGLVAENDAGYTPGAQPYIRRVGIQAASGDLVITVDGTAQAATGATVLVAGGAPSTEYVPGTDVLTPTGGTGTAPTFTVASTQVSAATINAAGSTSAINGSGYLVEGTTGTGTKFVLSCTITGGEIASIDAIENGGTYTANPSSLTAEPVVGIGFIITSATVGLSMGANGLTLTSAGSMTVLPPVPTPTSSGSAGVGATISIDWTYNESTFEDEGVSSGATPIYALNSTTFNFLTLGLQPGEWIFVGGDTSATQFANSEDNGFARIASVAQNQLIVDKTTQVWVPDAGTSQTIQLFFGSFLSNQVLPANIVRTTLQLERTLSSGGTEYVKGCVPDMFTITMNAAAKVTCEVKYVGIQTDLYEPAQGTKPGFRPNLPVSQAYTTTSDFGKLSLFDRDSGASLVNFMKDLTLVVNNQAQPVKALSQLGAIDVVVGDFQVSGAVTAYFTDVEAVEAVKADDDLTLDFALVAQNSGMLFDVPLMAVGGGRLNVVKDQAIEIPLTHNGAWDSTGTYNYVLSCTCYDFLPNLAQ